jgi:hypothetical protein
MVGYAEAITEDPDDAFQWMAVEVHHLRQENLELKVVIELVLRALMEGVYEEKKHE